MHIDFNKQIYNMTNKKLSLKQISFVVFFCLLLNDCSRKKNTTTKSYQITRIFTWSEIC